MEVAGKVGLDLGDTSTVIASNENVIDIDQKDNDALSPTMNEERGVRSTTMEVNLLDHLAELVEPGPRR